MKIDCVCQSEKRTCTINVLKTYEPGSRIECNNPPKLTDGNIEKMILQGNFDLIPNLLGFPTIKELFVSNTGLKEIQMEQMQQFPYLTRLVAEKNNITSLKNDVFKHNPDLEIVNLNGNQIEVIEQNIFKDLRNLKTLRLMKNQCIDAESINSINETQKKIKEVFEKCSNPGEEIQHEEIQPCSNLKFTIYLSLAFNIIQFIIIIMAVIGLIGYYKKVKEAAECSSQMVIMNEYDDPKDIRKADDDCYFDYQQPYNAPNRNNRTIRKDVGVDLNDVYQTPVN